MIEANWLWQVLFSFGFGGLISGGIVYLICTRWLSSYLNKKGENLATKEDIQAITHLVKGVEHQYNVMVEEMKGKQQLRMAAMDKRLQAHQATLPLWRKVMLASADNSKIVRAYYDCRTWYYENCLYLEPEVRVAFCLAFSHALQVNVLREEEGDNEEEIERLWKDVIDFPDVLVKAVQLPALNPEEREQITREPKLPDMPIPF
ncbi:hypothetical protein [Massilia suwonensis]|uniref:DUF4760 domain-containing protein n=1 Tax=Massilia suwonensis TaxID=648895 RepID=A0ABW0MUM2_9BURK